MGLYEQIRTEAKAKGYSINRLERELGFARSSINKFNKNTPGIDKLQKIASFLDISVERLLDAPSETTTFASGQALHRSQAAREAHDLGTQYTGTPYSGTPYSGTPYSGTQFSETQHSGTQYLEIQYFGTQYAGSSGASQLAESLRYPYTVSESADIQADLDALMAKLRARDTTIIRLGGVPLTAEALDVFEMDVTMAVKRLHILNKSQPK